MEICRIYLSGGMGDLSFEEQTKWRSMVKNAISYENRDYEKKPVFFDPTCYYNFEEVKQKSEKEVMNFDLNALRKSDLVIVNFNDPKSIGTAMELMLARELHIPIVGINKDNIELHPWLEESCDRICDSVRECVDYVMEFHLN